MYLETVKSFGDEGGESVKEQRDLQLYRDLGLRLSD